jgi:hypothetical protein
MKTNPEFEILSGTQPSAVYVPSKSPPSQTSLKNNGQIQKNKECFDMNNFVNQEIVHIPVDNAQSSNIIQYNLTKSQKEGNGKHSLFESGKVPNKKTSNHQQLDREVITRTKAPRIKIIATPKKTKGRNLLTNLVDLLFFIIELLLFLGQLLFIGFEIYYLIKSQALYMYQKIEFILYDSLFITCISMALVLQSRLISLMRRKDTLVNDMKNTYGKYIFFQAFLISISVAIQFVSLPMLNINGYTTFYYEKIGLYSAFYVAIFIYAAVVILMMWLKEGKDVSRRQHLLKATTLVCVIIHFIVSGLILSAIYLFSFNSNAIQQLFAQKQYDKYYYLRGFVEILIGFLLNGNYYYLILIASVVVFQGIELIGIATLFLKKRRIQLLWTIYCLIMLIPGSFSMAVIGLFIYSLCEFYIPNNIAFHTSLPVIYFVYCAIIHTCWIIPAILANIGTFKTCVNKKSRTNNEIYGKNESIVKELMEMRLNGNDSFQHGSTF